MNKKGNFTLLSSALAGLLLMIISCTSEPITVNQSGGAASLITECADRYYISNTANHIIEGTVKNVESRLEEGGNVFTYTDLIIEEYIKGTPFGENRLQIVTPGGTVGEIGQWVEDQPIFHEGKKVRIYLIKTNGQLSIVCAQFGVEEIPGD